MLFRFSDCIINLKDLREITLTEPEFIQAIKDDEGFVRSVYKIGIKMICDKENYKMDMTYEMSPDDSKIEKMKETAEKVKKMTLDQLAKIFEAKSLLQEDFIESV